MKNLTIFLFRMLKCICLVALLFVTASCHKTSVVVRIPISTFESWRINETNYFVQHVTYLVEGDGCASLEIMAGVDFVPSLSNRSVALSFAQYAFKNNYIQRFNAVTLNNKPVIFTAVDVLLGQPSSHDGAVKCYDYYFPINDLVTSGSTCCQPINEVTDMRKDSR